MDMRRLEIFLRVIEEGGFTRAAAAMNLTQPTLSAAVSQLEAELQTQLLNRTGRKVVPTHAGELLHGYAQRIFALRQDAVRELREINSGEQGALLLGGSTIPGTYVLPQIVADFRRQYAQVRVSLHLAATETLLADLQQRRLELALLGGKPQDRSFEAIRCLGDELVIIVPPDHHWSGSGTVPVQELVESPLLLREKGSATRKALELRLKDSGCAMRQDLVVAEVGGNEALKRGVLAGLGVAVVSRLAVEGELLRGELSALQFAGDPLHRSFYLVAVRGLKLSVVAERFKQRLLQEIGTG